MGDAFDDMGDLNPFSDPSVVAASKIPVQQPIPNLAAVSQPAAPVIQTTISKPESENYQWASQPVSQPPLNIPTNNINAELEELRRREEELKRRELELSKRESKVLSDTTNAPKAPNYPPFPSWFPVQPCFYIDIEEEIPTQHQKLIKKLHLKLIVYTITLLVNILAVATQLGSPVSGSTVAFILSIIVCIATVPSSFFFCFRSAYNAVKSNSSFYYILFFLSFGIEMIIHFVQLLGTQGYAYAGFINGAVCIDNLFVFPGAIGIIMGLVYTILLLASFYLFKEVRDVYKSGGGNLVQAQSEFNAGIWKQGGSALFAASQLRSNDNLP